MENYEEKKSKFRDKKSMKAMFSSFFFLTTNEECYK